MTQQDGDQDPSHNVENPSDKCLAEQSDRLVTRGLPAMSAQVVSPPVVLSVTREQTSQQNTKLTSELTNQQLSPSASGSATEAFVAWAPTKRIVNKRLITPDGKPQSGLPQIIHPESQAHQTAIQHVSALMRALGLAHHWQRLLRDRRMTSVKEIARAEGLSLAQVNRVLRLTLLAPSIIEWLIAASDSALEDIMNRPWPSCWATQLRSVFPTDKNPCAPWDQLGGTEGWLNDFELVRRCFSETGSVQSSVCGSVKTNRPRSDTSGSTSVSTVQFPRLFDGI